jgi:hypothetical protein
VIGIWFCDFRSRQKDQTTGEYNNFEIFYNMIFIQGFWVWNSAGSTILSSRWDDLVTAYTTQGVLKAVLFVLLHALRIFAENIATHSQLVIVPAVVWALTFHL